MAKRLNKTHLARALDVDRKTITGYLARKGAPKPDKRGLFEVEECRVWAAKCAAMAEHGNTQVRGTRVHELKERKLALEVEEEERKAAIRAGQLVNVAEIEPALLAMFSQLKEDLVQKFEQELPSRYRGRSLAECQQMNAEGVDWVLRRLKDGAQKITPA